MKNPEPFGDGSGEGVLIDGFYIGSAERSATLLTIQLIGGVISDAR